MAKIKSTKDIEDLAIGYVVHYLEDKGEKPKIIKKVLMLFLGKNTLKLRDV